MKRIVMFLVCLSLFSAIYFASHIFAQEEKTINPTQAPQAIINYNLPFSGILPDHPLYPLKVLRDKILTIFTRDPVKKFYLNLLFADKNLAMGQLLWEKGNLVLSIKTLSTGEKYLLNAAIQLMKLKQTGSLPEGVVDKLMLACDKHAEIIGILSSGSTNKDYLQKLNEMLEINHQAKQQAASLK